MNDNDNYENTYKKYLECAWHYAYCYINYTNELEKYNKIRSDKLTEYKNYYYNNSHILYKQYNATEYAYKKINISVTLQKQYKYLEYSQKKLKNINNTYNNLYDKLFKN